MKDFSEHPTCCKCGGNDVSLLYKAEEKATIFGTLHNFRERLMASCNRCQYKWYMEVKTKED